VADYVELKLTRGRHRYEVRTGSGLEFVMIAGWRRVNLIYDPDKVDVELLPDDTYRIVGVGPREKPDADK